MGEFEHDTLAPQGTGHDMSKRPLMHPCPACGHRTLDAQGAGQTCAVCGWEVDALWGVDYPSPGNGGLRLSDAQHHYEQRGAAVPMHLVGARRPWPWEGREPCWRSLRGRFH